MNEVANQLLESDGSHARRASKVTFDSEIMNRWKVILAGMIGVLVGLLGGVMALPIARASWDYFGPPTVTVMNATGGEISDVTMTLGTVSQPLPNMKDGHARTIRVRGHFSDCSTHVSWTDSAGKHMESAGDYMESCGSYRAMVVLTPDRKAKAIYEIKESNIERVGTSP